ncbi:hypothetical protein ACFQE1_18845, partial [Halobium palmae]
MVGEQLGVLRVGDGVLGLATPVSGGRFRAVYFAGDFTKQVLPMGHVSGPAILSYWVSEAVDLGYEETLAAVTVADLLNLAASLALAAVGVAV